MSKEMKAIQSFIDSLDNDGFTSIEELAEISVEELGAGNGNCPKNNNSCGNTTNSSNCTNSQLCENTRNGYNCKNERVCSGSNNEYQCTGGNTGGNSGGNRSNIHLLGFPGISF